ncbi:hypothetical protein [Frankia sp. Cr1]|uniref:hypothetical protein n=1 Tax=Frankia sp. Cr1 TaxID=3073931 RepID=UPI002AD37E35|nr:hypothetical protein [Frankia sp. Cr1]
MSGIIIDILPETAANPCRLGRHREHDPRSLAYAVAGLPHGALQSIRWTRRCPVFDQGSIGSCTGQAAAGWLGTDTATRKGDPGIVEDDALALYEAATRLDNVYPPGQYPPDDTGSTGLGVAKALRAQGEITRYRHAFGLRAALTALQRGPILFGTIWRAAMFTPDPDGRIYPAGTPAGGHEYLIDEVDVARGRIWLTNSWGPSWGVAGRAYLTWDDARLLLVWEGDVIVPV